MHLLKRSAAAAITLVALVGVGSASAQTNINSTQGLREAVGVPGILQHEQAFQAFATNATGNRLSGTPGYDASVQYVVNRMEAAGYDVEIQNFQYNLLSLADWSPPVLSIQGGQSFIPGIGGGEFGGDFGSAFSTNTKRADLTSQVFAVDLQLPLPEAAGGSTSGCQGNDFSGMPAGAIALIQRGTCTFVKKQENAERAGAGAVIVFNDGFPTRTEAVWSDATGQDIPVFDAATRVGQALANGVEQGLTGKTARVRIDWRPGTYTTSNVIAETPGGNADNVVAVGAHLDSVGTGPGINDNGSGSAGILEIAEAMANTNVSNKVRFLWFGAEESGLLGSTHYVASLAAAERAKIAAMLNFDMIASPNFVRFVYDGDNTLGSETQIPDGSDQIEYLFLNYFAAKGLPTEPTEFDGRSDYGPFIEAGIPAGGLFTGAEVLKTEAQEAIYGGDAGVPYDPCYHEGCDTLMMNLSNTALDQMSDAAAHATLSLAQSTRAINGVPGRGVFDVPEYPLPDTPSALKH